MLTYKRIIESTEIIIYIEEQLYNYMPNIFNSIFCTFELCNNNICNPNTIHIYSQKDIFEEYKYPCFCNTRNPMWIFILINMLENYLYELLNCTVLHGSCVRVNKKNVLIIGERKSGKSTLTQYLINNCSAEYMSDDSVFIKDEVYYGFAFPILMRKIVKKIKHIGTTRDEENIKRYIYSPVNILPQGNNIDLILFPKYDKYTNFQNNKLKNRYLFNSLIKNVKFSKDMRTIYKDISNLTNISESYQVCYNQCGNVASFIDKINNP